MYLIVELVIVDCCSSIYWPVETGLYCHIKGCNWWEGLGPRDSMFYKDVCGKNIALQANMLQKSSMLGQYVTKYNQFQGTM